MTEHQKIKVIADKNELLKLSSNTSFCNGIFLKHILRNLSKIILIMDEKELEKEWIDSESDLRKFFDAYDIEKPQAYSQLKCVYEHPEWCPSLDPFALWLFNTTADQQKRFCDNLGVWAISASDVDDQFFYIELPRGYAKDDVIAGPKTTGWGNYLCDLTKPVPPSNSIVINDRHLLLNTNERNALSTDANGRLNGFWGLNNLVDLFNEILPLDLKIPFHLYIYCQHPEMSIRNTDKVVAQFIVDVKALRQYEIKIEFVYRKSLHNRGIYSNYYTFYIDRAINAFRDDVKTQLNGENKFNLKSYLHNPFSMGDTEYDTAKRELSWIYDQGVSVSQSPNVINCDKREDIERTKTDCIDSQKIFHNRLFF